MAARQRSNAPLIVLAAFSWLAMAVIVAAYLYGERHNALERAARTGNALGLALESHTVRTFEAVDITLAAIASRLRGAPALPQHDAAFQRVLTARLEALQPYARAIFIIGADGRIIHDTDHPATPAIPLNDREYFRVHADNPKLVRSISGPLRSRSGLGWFVAVTRRIDEAQFRGVVVAALQPQYFEKLYASLRRGKADSIMLFHRDGTLIARYPAHEGRIGVSFAGYPLFAEHLPRAASGTYATTIDLFPHQRLMSYRALADMPLVVALGQSTDEILGSWRDSVLGASLALGALGLMLAALVTQFVRQQRIRDLARERLLQAEKLEALGHLTGSVSHDFANLLNIVSASLRTIALNAGDEGRVREAISVGERAVVRGSRLLDQLRAFSRRQPLHVQATNLNRLLVSGMELLQQASGPRVLLECELGAEVSRCLLDETELEVALVNLLVNARDAGAARVVLKTYDCSEQAKPPGWRGERPEGYVCLAVTDDGPGMPEEVRRRVFEPYFSTKGEQGTGLGLAQVYGLMRQILGDVHIDSRPGRGTTVYLLFPRAPAEVVPAAAQGQAA
jgi:signal transduction histidine kinase